jgi:CRISPR type I-F-associated protein Csy2
MSYVHLRNLSATDANTHAGYYMLGLPAMTGITGFAHVIQRHWHDVFHDEIDRRRRLKKNDTPDIAGVCFIVHSMQKLESHPKYVNYQLGSRVRGETAATIDCRGVHLSFDLILRVDEKGNENRTSLEEYIMGPKFLNFLKTLPFCSGRLTLPNRTVPGSVKQAISYFETKDGLKESLIGIPASSFIIEDAVDTLFEALKENPEKDSLSLLLDFIKRQKRSSREAEKKPREYRPWYIPIAVGYQALEEKPAMRTGSRNGYPHLFAEPVIGLGLARSMGSYRFQIEEDMDMPVFWRYKCETKDNLYIVKAQPL